MKQEKLAEGLYPDGLIIGCIFLFACRWAYNRGGLSADGLISGSLRYLNLDILAYSPSICNRSFLKAEIINRFRYRFSSHILVEKGILAVSHSMQTCVSIASSWKDAFVTLIF